MKLRLKGCIAIIIIITIIFPAAFANSAESEVLQKIEMLHALGIMDKVSEDKLEKNVTRSEFVVFAVRLFGLSIVTDYETKIFSDVSPDNYAYQQIAIAAQVGLISYYDNIAFRPDDDIQFTEVIKILTEALGYGVVAKESGGYPTGYMFAAQKAGLSLRNSGGMLNYSQLAGIIESTLNAYIYDWVSFGSNLTYKKGDTLLKARFKAQKISGKVTATEISGLMSTQPSGKGKITINNETFNLGGTNADGLIGSNVICYVQGDDEDTLRTIVALTADEGKTSKTLLNTDVDITVTGNTISYINENDRVINIRVAQNAPILINDVYFGVMRQVDFKSIMPDTGDITIVYADNSSEATSILISKYDTYVVDSVNTITNTIIDKYNNGKLELDKADTVRIHNYDEARPLTIGAIGQWDVLAVKQITTGDFQTIVDITIVSFPFKGIINEITTSKNGKPAYVIDGVEYKLAKNYLDAGEPELKLGEYAVFYVDISGAIAGIRKSAVSEYGYLSGASKNQGIDRNLKFKIYTLDRKFEIFEVADKWTLDGVSASSEKLPPELENIDGSLKTQLVIYKFNESGRLTEIQTAADMANVTDYQGYTKNKFTLDGIVTAETRLYHSYLGNVCAVSNNTIIFDIPGDKANEKGYGIKSRQDYASDEKQFPPCLLYDMSGTVVPDVIVIDRTTGAAQERVKDTDGMGFVKKVASAYSDENDVYRIYFSGRNDYLEILKGDFQYDSSQDFGYNGEADTPNLLREGDFIQYVLDDSGYITMYRVLFRACDPDRFTPQIYGIIEELLMLQGTVTDLAGNQQEKQLGIMTDIEEGGVVKKALRPFIYDRSSAEKYSTKAAGAYIHIYSNNKITLGTADDISKGDDVFFKSSWGNVLFVMVLK